MTRRKGPGASAARSHGPHGSRRQGARRERAAPLTGRRVRPDLRQSFEETPRKEGKTAPASHGHAHARACMRGALTVKGVPVAADRRSRTLPRDASRTRLCRVMSSMGESTGRQADRPRRPRASVGRHSREERCAPYAVPATGLFLSRSRIRFHRVPQAHHLVRGGIAVNHRAHAAQLARSRNSGVGHCPCDFVASGK